MALTVSFWDTSGSPPGTPQISYSHSDNTKWIQSAGFAGMRFKYTTTPGDTTGHHMDNFLAADIGPSGGLIFHLRRMSGGFTTIG